MILSAITVFCYAGAFGLTAWFLTGRSHLLRQHMAVIAAVPVVLHAIQIRVSAGVGESVDLSFWNALSLFGFTCAALMVAISARRPITHLGLVVLPLSALMVALASIQTPTAIESNADGTLDWKILTHIFLSVIAYGLLTLGAAQAIVTTWQDRRMHAGGAAPQQIPPLQTMENLLFELVEGGFFVLSLAIVSGLVFISDLFGQHLIHKTALSIFAWAVFGILLWGRKKFGWRGRIALRWALGGYTSLVLAYFGSKMVLELLLGTRWAVA